MQRRPDLIERIDEVVMAFADGEFLEALPALRRAFSVFTPREKDRLARSLPGGAGLERARGRPRPRRSQAMLELEARLRDALDALRGAVVSAERAARALAARARRARPRARSALRWTPPGAARDRALGFLYDARGGARSATSAGGSLDDSELTVPDWINDVHELFPRRVVERLEKDALERYGLLEIVTNQRGARSARRPT